MEGRAEQRAERDRLRTMDLLSEAFRMKPVAVRTVGDGLSGAVGMDEHGRDRGRMLLTADQKPGIHTIFPKRRRNHGSCAVLSN